MAKIIVKEEVKVEKPVVEAVIEEKSEKVAYIKGYDQYGNPSWGFK
jgi:hypothetical protein